MTEDEAASAASDCYIRAYDVKPPQVSTVHYVTRAWKVGQSHGDAWYHAAVCHTWEDVKSTAARLRSEGWLGGPIEALPFLCIVDGDTVHEVRSSPLNARGEWVPERANVVRVDE